MPRTEQAQTAGSPERLLGIYGRRLLPRTEQALGDPRGGGRVMVVRAVHDGASCLSATDYLSLPLLLNCCKKCNG